MKKLFLISIALLSLLFTGCKDKPQQWEYKAYVVEGNFPGLPINLGNSELDAYTNLELKPTQGTLDALNKLGAEGWELVAVTPEIETVYPNFGNKEYVTGIQPNTRTFSLTYLFKRPKQGKAEKESAAKPEYDASGSDTVVAINEQPVIEMK